MIESMHYPNIEPEDFIVPILHTEMGMVNKCVGHLKNWMDNDVEQIPQEELDARKEVDSEKAVMSALREETDKHDLSKFLSYEKKQENSKKF